MYGCVVFRKMRRRAVSLIQPGVEVHPCQQWTSAAVFQEGEMGRTVLKVQKKIDIGNA